MDLLMNKNEKISASLKKFFEENGHPCTGKPGWKPTEEINRKRSETLKATWDAKGRVSEAQKRAGNKANVYAYRARKQNAIPLDADLKLIKKSIRIVQKDFT